MPVASCGKALLDGRERGEQGLLSQAAYMDAPRLPFRFTNRF
jgi:hypothetical protein